SSEGKSQVWLLDRRGGEARQATDLKGDVDSYEWSPDGKRLVIAMAPSDDDDAVNAKPKAPKPIVIDRYHFKRDNEGYLTTSSLNHLYLFEVESKKLETLTSDK